MQRPGSALSKISLKTPVNNPFISTTTKTKIQKPTLEDFLCRQDYVGAQVFIDFEKKSNIFREDSEEWMAYLLFQTGEYQKAADIYINIINNINNNNKEQIENINNIIIYYSCCLYALCRYEESYKNIQKSSIKNDLYNRICYHISNQINDQNVLIIYNNKLINNNNIYNELCIAAMKYLCNLYNESINIYNKILIKYKEYISIYVYIAMCNYKLENYDTALENINIYLSKYNNSIFAVNLKACCNCQLYNGRQGEEELKTLSKASSSSHVFSEHDILRHNIAVFRNGENAPQVFTPLIDVIPEARLNLAIFNLKEGRVKEGYALIKDMKTAFPREYIIKAAVLALLGQQTESTEYIKESSNLYQMIGSNAAECDTIPGRQSMAACYILLKQFDDSLVYLKSIKSYFEFDDVFNWNYGIACAAARDYKEARDALIQIRDEQFKKDFCYITWIARCHIICGSPQDAWDMYSDIEPRETYSLLQLIANDCFRMGHFIYSCRAFDLLEKMDPDPEFSEGKRGAAVGVFQQVIAEKSSAAELEEVLVLLQNSNNPQVDNMLNRVITKWAKTAGISIET
eukprot:GHVL01041078.1.p1 GENE.GHVL01041078.1~~GHVL01041078.1.p1  ORF type:complete len:574 (+),score=150.25 GHVL01041078.1:93-1814(+)